MMRAHSNDNVIPFRLWTRYAPSRIADLYFMNHDAPLEQPTLLRRAFAQLAHQTDIRPETDSINAAHHALIQRGFNPLQIGVFMRIVQDTVGGFLMRYAQLLHGDSDKIEKLDLYYSHDFFLGVRLNGERLDYTPDYGRQIYQGICHSLQDLEDRTPHLFQIGSPTLSQRAENRPNMTLHPKF